MVATEHSRWSDLLPAHALGALDREESGALEEHLRAGCPECVAELALLRRDVEAIAESVPPLPPPPAVRQRLLEAIAAPPQRQPSNATRWLALAATVALLLAVTGGWRTLRLNDQLATLRGERDQLLARLAGVEEQLARSEGQRDDLLRQASEQTDVLGSRRLDQVQLAGLDAAPQAAGRTFVDAPAGRALFVATGLPPLAPGRTYQLWLIVSGKPVSGGTFDVGERGDARLRVQAPTQGTIDAWAVTEEPAGGVPLPTGAMLLKS